MLDVEIVLHRLQVDPQVVGVEDAELRDALEFLQLYI